MQKSRSTLALALLAGALSAGSAASQSLPADAPGSRSELRGFMLGGSFSGGVVGRGSLQGGNTVSPGFGVTLGFGVSDRVTLFTRGDYAYRATYLDVGARYSFGAASSALRPYVEGAITGAATGLRGGAFGEPGERGIRSTAAALTAGVGVEYFVAPNLALDLGLGYSRGRWIHSEPGEARIGESGDFSTPRLNLGIRWRP